MEAAVGVDGADADQVARLHALLDETPRRVLRPLQRVRRRVAEIEQKEKRPPRRRIHRRGRGGAANGEVDRIERRDLLLLPFVEQLEVRRAQPAYRIAVSVDDGDGYLDQAARDVLGTLHR